MIIAQTNIFANPSTFYSFINQLTNIHIFSHYTTACSCRCKKDVANPIKLHEAV